MCKPCARRSILGPRIHRGPDNALKGVDFTVGRLGRKKSCPGLPGCWTAVCDLLRCGCFDLAFQGRSLSRGRNWQRRPPTTSADFLPSAA